jgi:L-asparaginase
VVLESYGAGTFPTDEKLGRSLLPFFKAARRQGAPVVVVSQAIRNGVDLALYESGEMALAEGAISGGDMTSSAALVKLMHALAYYKGPKAIRRYLETPVAGELTG